MPKTASPSRNIVPSKVIVGESGLVEKELFQGDQIRITRAKAAAYLSSTMEWRPRNFVAVNVEEMKLLSPGLSVYEKAFLSSVQCYIGYEDCMLKIQNDDGTRDVIFKDLLEITGIGKTKLAETIKALREKDILYVGENSRNNQYFVNPWLFNKGLRINKVLAAMFQNYRVLSMGGKRWRDLKI